MEILGVALKRIKFFSGDQEKITQKFLWVSHDFSKFSALIYLEFSR